MTYPCDGRLGLPPIMLFKTQSASVYGIDAYLVEVEVDVGSARMQDFNVVGLPDNAVKCQRNRVTPAPVIDLEPVALAQGTYNFFNCCSVAGVVSPNLHGIYS